MDYILRIICKSAVTQTLGCTTEIEPTAQNSVCTPACALLGQGRHALK